MNPPFSFIWPAMLITLVIIPLFAVLYLVLQRRRAKLAASYGGLGTRPGAGGLAPGLRRHIPAGLFLTGLAVLLLASARPQAVVSLPNQEGTLILAFDVSGSMAADDLQPTRMEAAKAVARDFIERQPSSLQIGVVAFSGSGLAVQKPTDDQEAILAAINRLKPELGTSLGQGILASLEAIAQQSGEPNQTSDGSAPAPTPTPMPPGTYTSAAIVLLTDGENTAPPDPLLAAQAAADRGVRIFTIGIGSPAGTLLHVNGFTVHTRLDEAALEQIAQQTGGAYFLAENAQDLHKIYEDITPHLVVKPEKMEITSILAGASLLFMLIGGVFSLLWFGRLP